MVGRRHYGGTSKFTKDITLVENYEAALKDTTQVWECHHRLETHDSDGTVRLVPLLAKELRALGMYYDRPPEELIFLNKKDHYTVHIATHSKPPIHWGNKPCLGRKWYNNGIKSVMAYSCPEGFTQGRIYKHVVKQEG